MLYAAGVSERHFSVYSRCRRLGYQFTSSFKQLAGSALVKRGIEILQQVGYPGILMSYRIKSLRPASGEMLELVWLPR
jgi:hypothetical protein